MKTISWFVPLCASVLLAACGGGGGGDDSTPAPVPDPDARNEMPASAGASVAAFQGALAGLPTDDRANPLDLSLLDAPTSDTAEPQALE